MKNLSSLILVFFFIIQLNGQDSALLNQLKANSENIWIGEMEIDYTFNKESDYWDIKETEWISPKSENLLHLLKFSVERNAIGFPKFSSSFAEVNNYLIHKIFEVAKEEKITFYKDKFCKEILPAHEVKGRLKDTVEVFHPDLFAGHTTELQLNDLDPKEIYAFRVFQYIVYNKKEARYKSYPLSIAPKRYSHSYIDEDDIDETIGSYQLFWFPIQAFNDLDFLNNKEVTWSIAVKREIPLNQVKVIKGDQSIAELMHLMMNTIADNKLDVYTRDSYGGSYHQKIDAISFKEKFIPQNIKKIQLYQEFAWDNQKQQFFVRDGGFIPIENYYNDDNIYSYKLPIFFRSSDVE